MPKCRRHFMSLNFLQYRFTVVKQLCLWWEWSYKIIWFKHSSILYSRFIFNPVPFKTAYYGLWKSAWLPRFAWQWMTNDNQPGYRSIKLRIQRPDVKSLWLGEIWKVGVPNPTTIVAGCKISSEFWFFENLKQHFIKEFMLTWCTC